MSGRSTPRSSGFHFVVRPYGTIRRIMPRDPDQYSLPGSKQPHSLCAPPKRSTMPRDPTTSAALQPRRFNPVPTGTGRNNHKTHAWHDPEQQQRNSSSYNTAVVPAWTARRVHGCHACSRKFCAGASALNSAPRGKPPGDAVRHSPECRGRISTAGARVPAATCPGRAGLRRESDQAGAKGLDRGVVLVQAAQFACRVGRMTVHGEHGQVENRRYILRSLALQRPEEAILFPH